MATLKDALKAVNAYPIPLLVIETTAVSRGVDCEQEATQESMGDKAFKLTLADILTWLSTAPNISQGGQTYSFSEDERLQFRKRAQALYDECEETGNGMVYGYKGSKL